MKWFNRKKHEVKLQDMIIFAKDKDGNPIECENCGICLSSVGIVLADDKQYKRAERLFNKIIEERDESNQS